MRFIKLHKRQPSGESVLWALFLYRGYKFRGTRVMCFRISGVSQAVSARSERKIRGEMSGKMCCVFTVSKVYTFRRLHSTSYFLMRHGTPASKSRTKAVASRLAVHLSYCAAPLTRRASRSRRVARARTRGLNPFKIAGWVEGARATYPSIAPPHRRSSRNAHGRRAGPCRPRARRRAHSH